MTVRAPGKFFLFGEYAVLDGGAAIVAAVARHAVARLERAEPRAALGGTLRLVALGPEPHTHRTIDLPLAAASVSPHSAPPDIASSDSAPPDSAPPDSAPAHSALGPVPRAVLAAAHATSTAAAIAGHTLTVDTRAFSALTPHGAWAKLGLGSSAAATVASVGAVYAAAGADLASPAVRASIVALAMRAHADAQGGVGSGADVAASVHGGVLAFRRDPAGGPPALSPLPPAPFRHLDTLWTGAPASSARLVADVLAWATRDPAAWRALRDVLAAPAEALAAGRPLDLAAAAAAAFDALDALGAHASVPIVTPPMRDARARLAPLGRALKPSGAGGGDLVWVVGPSDRAPQHSAAAHVPGLVPLALTLDEIGVAVDHEGLP